MTELQEELRTEIQQGYSDFLKANNLKARTGQKQMIAAIARELAGIELNAAAERTNSRGICVVEAGTGTGKTLAYLLATLPIAQAAGKTVVISTGTVALQEQLINRDIPALLASTGWEYHVVLAKGRGRYLCPLRLEQCTDVMSAQEQGLFLFEDEISFDPSEQNRQCYQDMADAFESGEWDGDRDNWPEQLEVSCWQPLTVDRRQCGGRRCKHYHHCPFYQARDELESADCIVANHDLVLADLSLGGGIILPSPANTLYVFDEAHRLNSTALAHFSASCRLETTLQLCSRIQQTLKKIRKDTDYEALLELIDKGSSAAGSAEESMALALPMYREVLDRHLLAQNTDRFRFPAGRIDPGLQEAAIFCASKLGLLTSRLQVLQDTISAMIQPGVETEPELEGMQQQLGQWLSRLENDAALWHFYASDEAAANSPPIARWINRIESATVMDMELAASPTHAAGILQQHLFAKAYAVVMTSATLQALGSFASFIDAIGLPETAQCHAVSGVFDYANAASLAIPDIKADGSDPDAHTEAIIQHLPQLIEQGEGTLVLFSSRLQMEAVAKMLDESLQEKVLMQYTLSNQRLLETHREKVDSGATSVIFGLASFAEGVDLPGNYCRHVVIAKLPFSVPDDPIKATLADWLEARSENAFAKLMLPEASLRLNQACGRLLRTETDTGRITILDRRILKRGYGRKLLQGLPPFRRDYA